MEYAAIFLGGVVLGYILKIVHMRSESCGTLLIDPNRDRVRFSLDGVFSFDELPKRRKFILLKIEPNADLPSQENQGL